MKTVIRVHPAIKEFIVCTQGSDIIFTKSSSKLWAMVKRHLETKSNVEKETIPNRELIYICLLNPHGEKVLLHKGNKEIYIDVKYRRYLSKSGQFAIASELRSRFKNIFHTFMLAALLANPNMLQKEALILFIEKYKITLDEINFDMLIKSWDRSDEKKMLQSKKQEIDKCPIIY